MPLNYKVSRAQNALAAAEVQAAKDNFQLAVDLFSNTEKTSKLSTQCLLSIAACHPSIKRYVLNNADKLRLYPYQAEILTDCPELMGATYNADSTYGKNHVSSAFWDLILEPPKAGQVERAKALVQSEEFRCFGVRLRQELLMAHEAFGLYALDNYLERESPFEIGSLIAASLKFPAVGAKLLEKFFVVPEKDKIEVLYKLAKIPALSGVMVASAVVEPYLHGDFAYKLGKINAEFRKKLLQNPDEFKLKPEHILALRTFNGEHDAVLEDSEFAKRCEDAIKQIQTTTFYDWGNLYQTPLFDAVFNIFSASLEMNHRGFQNDHTRQLFPYVIAANYTKAPIHCIEADYSHLPHDAKLIGALLRYIDESRENFSQLNLSQFKTAVMQCSTEDLERAWKNWDVGNTEWENSLAAKVNWLYHRALTLNVPSWSIFTSGRHYDYAKALVDQVVAAENNHVYINQERNNELKHLAEFSSLEAIILNGSNSNLCSFKELHGKRSCLVVDLLSKVKTALEHEPVRNLTTQLDALRVSCATTNSNRDLNSDKTQTVKPNEIGVKT